MVEYPPLVVAFHDRFYLHCVLQQDFLFITRTVFNQILEVLVVGINEYRRAVVQQRIDGRVQCLCDRYQSR